MIPQFSNRKDMAAWFRANKHLVLTAKKSAMKFADPVQFLPFTLSSSGAVEKAEGNPELLNLDTFPVKVVINTTNLMDSYSDVHFPGIWTKTLKEARLTYLLQEHKMSFDKVISDQVAASVRSMTWKELGFEWPGATEALVFDAQVEKARNEYMAEQYARGRVKNHSVGMRYMNLFLALNSDERWDEREREVWDKYIDQIVNRDQAEEQGYFFAVTEAKMIEGSAVLCGANFATPTISIGTKEEAPDAAVSDDTAAGPLFGLKFLSNI